jgi:putative holliday junction resolvase
LSTDIGPNFLISGKAPPAAAPAGIGAVKNRRNLAPTLTCRKVGRRLAGLPPPAYKKGIFLPTQGLSRAMDLAVTELAASLAPGQRLLGLDPGSKTIGVAVSDSSLKVASPLETIKRGKFADDAARLASICKDYRIGGLIIGLPVNMDGSEGPRCQSVRQLARNLTEKAGFAQPIAFWDERLSTAAVERFLVGEADMTRKRRAAVVDKMAAAYILQGALDAIAGQAASRQAGPHQPDR